MAASAKSEARKGVTSYFSTSQARADRKLLGPDRLAEPMPVAPVAGNRAISKKNFPVAA